MWQQHDTCEATPVKLHLAVYFTNYFQRVPNKKKTSTKGWKLVEDDWVVEGDVKVEKDGEEEES